MAITLDRIPTERITAQAREVRFWHTILTLIAGLLFGLGWLAFKAGSAAWLAAAWSACAVREGWREARNDRAKRTPGRTS